MFQNLFFFILLILNFVLTSANVYVTGSNDEIIKIWNDTTTILSRNISRKVNCLEIDLNRNMIITGTESGKVVGWDFQNNLTITDNGNETFKVNSVLLINSTHCLAGYYGFVIFWSLPELNLIKKINDTRFGTIGEMKYLSSDNIVLIVSVEAFMIVFSLNTDSILFVNSILEEGYSFDVLNRSFIFVPCGINDLCLSSLKNDYTLFQIKVVNLASIYFHSIKILNESIGIFSTSDGRLGFVNFKTSYCIIKYTGINNILSLDILNDRIVAGHHNGSISHFERENFNLRQTFNGHSTGLAINKILNANLNIVTQNEMNKKKILNTTFENIYSHKITTLDITSKESIDYALTTQLDSTIKSTETTKLTTNEISELENLSSKKLSSQDFSDQEGKTGTRKTVTIKSLDKPSTTEFMILDSTLKSTNINEIIPVKDILEEVSTSISNSPVQSTNIINDIISTSTFFSTDAYAILSSTTSFSIHSLDVSSITEFAKEVITSSFDFSEQSTITNPSNYTYNSITEPKILTSPSFPENESALSFTSPEQSTNGASSYAIFNISSSPRFIEKVSFSSTDSSKLSLMVSTVASDLELSQKNLTTINDYLYLSTFNSNKSFNGDNTPITNFSEKVLTTNKYFSIQTLNFSPSTKFQLTRSNGLTTETDLILDKINGNLTFNSLNLIKILEFLNSEIDFNDCLLNCSGNGICMSFDNIKFTCECFSYYAGSKCEINTLPCSSNPCRNNGSCINNLINKTYTCQCFTEYNQASLYYGTYCENKIDVCENEKCSNNGICYDNGTNPECKCFPLYYGNKCEIESNEIKRVKLVINTASIIAIILLSITFSAFIFCDIFKLLTRNKLRKKHLKHSGTKNKNKR